MKPGNSAKRSEGLGGCLVVQLRTMSLLYLEKVIGDFKIEEMRRRLMETRNNITPGVCVIPAEK